MKCSKCGPKNPSVYYFEKRFICIKCYIELHPEKKEAIHKAIEDSTIQTAIINIKQRPKSIRSRDDSKSASPKDETIWDYLLANKLPRHAYWIRAFGKLFLVTGICLVIFVIVDFFYKAYWSLHDYGYYNRIGILAQGVSQGMLAFAGYLFCRSARLRAQYANEVFKKDPRSPILYLRPFNIDKTGENDSRYPDLAKSFEEHLAAALKEIGPLIAVGDPCEWIPTSGASRLYMKHDNWQENVKDLLRIAQLVVIHIGDSKGLLWELQTSFKMVEPKNLILCLPYTNRESRQYEYDRFRNSIFLVIPWTLPKKIEDALFIYFDNSWNAYLLTPTISSEISQSLEKNKPFTLALNHHQHLPLYALNSYFKNIKLPSHHLKRPKGLLFLVVEYLVYLTFLLFYILFTYFPHFFIWLLRRLFTEYE